MTKQCPKCGSRDVTVLNQGNFQCRSCGYAWITEKVET